MIKRMISSVLLIVSIACLGVEFNEDAFKNPPKNIVKGVFPDGNISLRSETLISGKNNELDFEFTFAPRILIEKNIPQIQLLYFVNKGYPDFFEVVFKSGKTLQLKLHDKLRLEGEGDEAGLVSYRSKFLISADQYYTYFIKDIPVKLKVKIPGFFNGKVCETAFSIGRLKAFQDMKIFFKE